MGVCVCVCDFLVCSRLSSWVWKKGGWVAVTQKQADESYLSCLLLHSS